MTDRAKIHVIANGFKFCGKITKETIVSIAIIDDKTQKEFEFSKNNIYIERDGD